MKRIALFLLVVIWGSISKAQNEESIFQISNGLIEVNNRFIMTEDLSAIMNLPYSVGNPINLTINSTVYTMFTGRFIGWEKAPGDYDIIEIRKNNQTVLLFRDDAGILKYRNSRYALPKYTFANIFAQYSDNDYFISISLNNGARALVFMGKPYGTDLPKLMIFVFTERDVKLVYYNYMNVNSIYQTSNQFSMQLQSNNQESKGNGNFSPAPITHTIWLENGLLKFRNN